MTKIQIVFTMSIFLMLSYGTVKVEKDYNLNILTQVSNINNNTLRKIMEIKKNRRSKILEENKNLTGYHDDFFWNKKDNNNSVILGYDTCKSNCVNKIEAKENKKKVDVESWNKENLTTDFNLVSSDFNAKDNADTSPKNTSQLNVPEKNEIFFNSMDDLDQLSFINNSSFQNNVKEFDNEKQRESQKLFNFTAEDFDREQKNLMSEVTNFGLREMQQFYEVKEREIYEAGFFLPPNSPESYLAAFNHQSPELKKLSQYGFAALKASALLKEELANSKLRQEILNVTEDSTKDFPEISLLDTSLHDNCPLKNRPKCPPWNHLFRTMDGTCNNLKNPWWGAIFQPLKRFLAPHYSDGLEAVREAVRGGPLPSPRIISTEIHWDKDVSSKSVTHMLMQWGQFIDHDMTSSSQSRGFNGSVPRCCNVPFHLQHRDCLPIEIPSNDRFFSQFGIRCLEFLRSAPASRLGCGLGSREQINQVTSYIDGSMIYGNNEREAARLRLFRNGMLKYTRMPQRLPLLPADKSRGEFCKDSSNDFFCFLSGDFRMNEQPGLMAMHIIFLRLHNRLTRHLAHLNHDWSDERLYQETRKIVGAILQHITYREFLPIVLGQDIMNIFGITLVKEGYYDGYSEAINGASANAFSTAAFRFGHSMVQGKFLKWDDIRKEAIFNLSLHEELQDPSSLHKFGAVDNFMMGMCVQGAQKRDEHFTSELTNHLFQTPNFPAGLDLASINIQRGRDHGLPSYNSWRNPCGLRKIKTWNDFLHVMPEETRDSIRRVYRDIDDVDLFVGGLAEFSVRGGLVGSTFACLIAQNFRNLRKGDRFWYENGGLDSSFTLNQLKSIRRVTLARILCDNLDLIENIQPFVFLIEDSFRNPKISCRNTLEIPKIDLSPWEESPKGKWNLETDSLPNISLVEMPEPKFETEVTNELPRPINLQNLD